MAKEKKELEKKEKAQVPAVLDFEQDAGAGFEETTSDDLQTPFLVCLQKGSPQVDDDNPAAPTLPDAKAGMLMNSVTQELYDGDSGVLVVPCFYRRSFVQWEKRETGGGFLGEYAADDPIVNTTTRNEKGQDELPDGTILVDTRTHYVLLVKPDGDYTPMILPMSSTQVKKSRRWMTIMSTLKVQGKNGLFNPPMYSHEYRIKTIKESNSKGSWRGFDISMEGPITDPNLYEAAKNFHELAKTGSVKPAESPSEQPPDEDVPF